MKIPYSWLKDYVDTKLSAKDIAERLTMAGLEVEDIEKVGDDFVFHAEVTTNRPDWLSILGVAREVCALEGKKLKQPKTLAGIAQGKKDGIKISIEDKEGCKRYIGWVVEDVKVGPSPAWLVEKLSKVGVRSINNVVDITNFVLFEYGQPMHAFDHDKLLDKTIIVRKAKQGEEITTLDGIKRKLDPEKLVIADAKRPIALAGVIGGLDTEVTAATKTILLESAYFDPPTVRKASRALGVSTDSSYRFERNVDYEGVYTAASRAAYLLQDLAGAKITHAPVDVSLKKTHERSVALETEKLEKILGAQVPLETLEKILSGLGFNVEPKKGLIKVIPPSFRDDINIPEDLIEEIARIWGYDKVPVVVPRSPIEMHAPKTALREVEDKARDLLVALGLDEVITYSLLSKEQLAAFSYIKEDIVELANPLSNEQAVMRNSLIPGMLGVIARNINHKNLTLRLFELSKIYRIKEKKPHEEIDLCLAVTGNRFDNWQDKKKTADFYDLKGMAEALFRHLGINSFRFVPGSDPMFSPGACAYIEIDNTQVGIMGKIGSQAQQALDIAQDVFLCEIFFEKAFPYIEPQKRYKPIPKQLPVSRDVSMLVPDDVTAAQITELARKSGGKLVKDVRIFDLYQGKNIPAGRKSIAFSVEYLDETRPLTDNEVAQAHTDICKALEKQLKAQIR